MFHFWCDLTGGAPADHQVVGINTEFIVTLGHHELLRGELVLKESLKNGASGSDGRARGRIEKDLGVLRQVQVLIRLDLSFVLP